MVKIGLKQKDDEEGIVVEVLLDSEMIGLVMSSEFARKNKFRKNKLEQPIYVRNVNSMKKIEIDVIEGQKWSVILGMLWLACYNPEIDWKTGKVKMMRCPEECGKKQKTKQTKP